VFSDAAESKNEGPFCRISGPARKVMVRVIHRAYEGDGRIIVSTEDIETLSRADLDAIRRYCQEHTDSAVYQGRYDRDAVAFVIESCIVTLHRFSTGEWSVPRSVLLTPVFVGKNRVGGVSFFSQQDGMPGGPACRDLKIFARNLLTFIAVSEGVEVEVDRRVAEEISPVTHLFLHTFNKAFTTPVQNIADEIESYVAGSLKNDNTDEPSNTAGRLQAIAIFLRSFSARWAGTFPALQASFGEERGQRRFVPLVHLARLEHEVIVDHIRSTFAVTMANDIYDDESFCGYRRVLQDMHALDRLVKLDIRIGHAIPGTADLWYLHLLHMTQNSLEALNLFEALDKFRKRPAYAVPLAQVEIQSKSNDGDRVTITIDDNGLPFDRHVREGMSSLLLRLGDANQPPASLKDMTRRIRNNRRSYSTKSAQSYGAGIIGFAHYLSRICRVEFKEKDRDFEGGRVVERGSIRLAEHPGQPKITISVPVPADSQEDVRTGIFFERQT